MLTYISCEEFNKLTRQEKITHMFLGYRDDQTSEFWQFHDENPQVYKMFKDIFFEAKNRGFTHYSSTMIIHIMRWERKLETSDNEFKICNNWASFYSRLFVCEYPQFYTFFRFRIIKGHTETPKDGRPIAEYDYDENGQGSFI